MNYSFPYEVVEAAVINKKMSKCSWNARQLQFNFIRRSSSVLVMISSKSVSTCNRFHAGLVESIAEIARFEGGTQIW